MVVYAHAVICSCIYGAAACCLRSKAPWATPGWACGLLSAGTFLIGEKQVAIDTDDTAEMNVYAHAAINNCIEERRLDA